MLIAQLCLTLQSHGQLLASLPCPWNFPGKNTRVGCHSLLQGIFPTQGSNTGLLHCRQILYHLNHQRSLVNLLWNQPYLSLPMFQTGLYDNNPRKTCNAAVCARVPTEHTSNFGKTSQERARDLGRSKIICDTLRTIFKLGEKSIKDASESLP